MASIGYSVEAHNCTEGTVVYSWSPLTEADTAVEVVIHGATLLSIQIEGTFGVGGSVGLEGSNSVSGAFSPYTTLSSFSAPGISPVEETSLRVRPTILAGTGVSVTIYLLVK